MNALERVSNMHRHSVTGVRKCRISVRAVSTGIEFGS
jgi:hypothetical protein